MDACVGRRAPQNRLMDAYAFSGPGAGVTCDRCGAVGYASVAPACCRTRATISAVSTHAFVDESVRGQRYLVSATLVDPADMVRLRKELRIPERPAGAMAPGAIWRRRVASVSTAHVFVGFTQVTAFWQPSGLDGVDDFEGAPVVGRHDHPGQHGGEH